MTSRLCTYYSRTREALALALEETPCNLKGNIQRPSRFAKGLRVGDNTLQAAHGEYDATVKMGRVRFDSLGRESGPTVRPASQLPGMTPPEERRHDGRRRSAGMTAAGDGFTTAMTAGSFPWRARGRARLPICPDSAHSARPDLQSQRRLRRRFYR